MLSLLFDCGGDWRGKDPLYFMVKFPPLSPPLSLLHSLFGVKLSNLASPLCNHAKTSQNLIVIWTTTTESIKSKLTPLSVFFGPLDPCPAACCFSFCACIMACLFFSASSKRFLFSSASLAFLSASSFLNRSSSSFFCWANFFSCSALLDIIE